MTRFVELDVRPILAHGGEPFGRIMSVVGSLRPGEGLRLLAPFRPVPLFRAMAAKGFSHHEREIGGGDFEVLFVRSDEEELAVESGSAPAEDEWPDPLMHLDHRELDPPDAMIRLLGATEAMQAGEVMSALLRRKPDLLLPELEKRGHAWRGCVDRKQETYRLLVRIGGSREGGPA